MSARPCGCDPEAAWVCSWHEGEMTPEHLIDLAVLAADQIDTEKPGLRESGQGREWITAVAARANTLGSTDVFGTKDAGAGRPMSYDTIGILYSDGGGFYAVSLCRDGEGYPRRLIDYGPVDSEQRWYPVPPEQAQPEPEPEPAPTPAPGPSDPTLDIIINLLTKVALDVADNSRILKHVEERTKKLGVW